MSEGLSPKEEYIAQCMTSGKTREECEQAWNEAHKAPEGDKAKDYSTLVRETAMQKVKIEQLSDQLREATKLIKNMDAEHRAQDDADKFRLACQIETDTKGEKKRGDLMKESKRDLSIMKETIDVMNKAKGFVSVSMLLDESDKKKKPQLTVGQWNPDTKQYEGGN